MDDECAIEWGDCEVTEAEHECDRTPGHENPHHCGYCGEES